VTNDKGVRQEDLAEKYDTTTATIGSHREEIVEDVPDRFVN